MDFEPRITSDGLGWQCNFHFGYGYDIIEDAKNEDACVQALQYLIAKADAEIEALEDELAIHQCQLKWAEEDDKRNPYEVSCATFQRKIDTLTTSIKDLRSRNLSNEHDLVTTVKNQRPAERICDIIGALVKQEFSAPDEQWQVEDLYNGMSLVNSGSVDNGLDLKEKTTPESAELKELMTESGSLCKHGDTISEESCSDTAKYAIRGSTEGRDVSKSAIEVTGSTEVDAYGCSPEVYNGFIGHFKAYCDNGNLWSPALPHGVESEECMTGSKYSGSGSSPLSAKADVVVKVEDNTNDMSIEHIVTDSFYKTQDHDSKCPIEAHQEVKENQSKSVDHVQRTYGRKKSILDQRQKIQKKNPTGAKQFNPSLNGKRQRPTNVGNSQSQSPSSEAESFCSLPESIVQPVDIAHGYEPGVLGGKKCKLLGASREDAGIQFQEDASIQFQEVKEEDGFCASENLASKPQKELVVCLQSPRFAQGIPSLLHSSSADLHNVRSKNSVVEDVGTMAPPARDLESLKLKLSQDPEFINKLKVAELKEILKYNKVRGFSKLKKEQMAKELNNLLRAT